MAILSGIYEPYYYFGIGEAIVLFIYGIILLASIGLYIMQSIAVMKMAKKRNIKNGWLAWIPVASDYMFGKVSEPTGKGKKTGITLLVLNIVMGAVWLIFTIVMFAFLVAVGMSELSSDAFYAQVGFSFIIAFLLGFVVILGVSIAYIVVKFIAYYRICENFGGESGTGFFIGILITTLLDIGIVPPILMLVLASKTPIDAGEITQTASEAPQTAAEEPKPEKVQMIAPEISAPEAQEVPQEEEKIEEAAEEKEQGSTEE